MSIAYEALIEKLQFGLPDRLAKSQSISGLTNAQIADALGVSPNTVSNYTNGRTKASKLVLKEWALLTGVPLSWIETGETKEIPHPDDPDRGFRAGATPPAGKTSLYHLPRVVRGSFDQPRRIAA